MASNSECKVYSYRLYDVQPSAILCLKYDEKTQFLAVSRENGSIEIWRHYENRCWDQFGFIPAEPEERRVDNLEWTKYGHLLSTGIDGLINQYDIKTLMPTNSFDSGAGVVWTMKHSPTQDLIAIGGEDGIVRLYDVIDTTDDNCLQYNKSFERQDSRILSICWHPRGKSLCTSGINTVRIWNSETGRMTRQLTLPKENQNDVTVWSCLFLNDNTVVVGDSLGRVIFYDGKLGALLNTFKLHDADVLTLAVSPNEKQIFASGVDPLVVSLEVARIKDTDEDMDGGREFTWRRSWGHKMHSHDVRGLEIVNNLLLSAGVDTRVVVAKQKRKEGDISKTSTILQSFRQTKVCSISREAKMFSLQHENKIDLWKMSKILPSTSTNGRDGERIPCEAPIHLTSISTESIRWTRLSPDGNYLAFSTLNKLRVYRIDTQEYNIQINKLVVSLPSDNLPALALEFSPDSKKLYFGHSIKKINVLELQDENVIQGQPIEVTDASDLPLRDIITSKDGEWIIAMGHESWLYHLSSQSQIKLPSTTTAFTSMAFIGPIGDETIMAGTASRDIHEFTMDGEYTEWSSNSKIPNQWRQYRSKVTSISQFKDCSIIICDNESFTVLDRKQKGQKFLRKIKSNESNTNDKKEFTEVSRWKYVLHCEMFDENEILLIEQPVGHVMENLPPSLKQKRFALK